MEIIRISREIPVAAEGPYPEIHPAGPNPRTVQLLSQDIVYSKGELSEICGYTYQHWVLERQKPRFSETLLRIAKVEMHHLEILGQLITALGGDPRYRAAPNGPFWSGNMIRYCRNYRQILTMDLSAERDAADLYESQSRYVRDPNVSAILARIALDERVHYGIFQKALEDLDASRSLIK